MSVASQWKLKEKEAAAAAVSKTGITGARGKTEAAAKDAPGGGGGAVGGQFGIKGQIEKPGTLEAAKPVPPQATPFGKQGQSKLPFGKDTSKSFQTRETDVAHTKDGAVVGATPPTSKIPFGAKENMANVRGKKLAGAGPKKEEPPSTIRSKAEDSKAKATELKKEPAGGAKESANAAAAAGDDGPFGSGRTKGLAGFWANQNDEVKAVKKKRLTAVEENLTPMVVENTPQQLEGVVRAQDPGEWKKPLQVEDGWTKNVVSSLQKRQQESFARKAPISLVDDTSNEKSDASQDAEAAKIKVKDISQRLVSQHSEPNQKPKEKLVIDRSQGAIVLAENQPMEVDPDVVRSDDASKEEVVLEKGRTRNLLQLWKNTEVEYNTPKTSTSRYQGSKPAWILEIEAAKGNTTEKNEEDGEPQENNAMTANDESDKSATQLPERASEIEVTAHAEDKQNIVLDNYPCMPLPKEMDNNVDIAPPKESTSVETMKASEQKTDTDKIINVEENDRTINKDISCEETPTVASLDILSQVQEAVALPDLVPIKVEISEKPLTPELAEVILIGDAHVEQSCEAPAPLVGTKLKHEVCEQVKGNEPIQNRLEEEKDSPKVLPEETTSDSEVFNDVISSSVDQNKALQESTEGEKEVHKLSLEDITPICEASEKITQNEPASQQQVLSSESSTIALNQQEPSEKVCEVHQVPSTQITPKQDTEGSHQTSDVALNLTQAENIGAETNRNESEVALEQKEIEINEAGGVEPNQRHGASDEVPHAIIHDSPSKPEDDDSVSQVSSIQTMLPLPQVFLDYSGTPEEAPKRIPDEAMKMQSETNSISEGNKAAVTSETHEAFSDHETFSTPTTTPVILEPSDSAINTKQKESSDSEPKEHAEKNENKTSDESSFTEGSLIDLQAESNETKRENSNLASLDDLLRIEPSPSPEYSTADNTPCLVPVSSPSTPELSINSERSSGFFDSDAEKETVWFSPQEDLTVTTAKKETISTQHESDYSSESLKRKAGDGKTTGKKDEPTTKADTSQRSCRVM